MDILDSIRGEARRAPPSGIAAVYAYGQGKPGLIKLWVGEGDLPTPNFISEPTQQALRNGETFYTWQGGIPELREALARYHTRHFGRDFLASEFLVVGGGMQAIQLALQATAGAGDEVICLAPAWPNAPAAVEVTGGKAVRVLLDRSDNGWTCDVERIAAAVTGRTTAIFVNSPANPTGWTADRATLAAILDLARRRNLWIIADETYAQFHYDGSRAPSFLDVMDAEDRVLFVNTFSKNWAMTGWRIGWIGTHPALGTVFENLIQYSTSGVAQFMQRGAIAALDHGDAFIASQVERAHRARDILCSALKRTESAHFAVPPGSFYLFFSVDGVTDSRQTAFEIIDKANVGLAPGAAFGPEGEGCFRVCFNRRLDQIEEGAERLARWIESR
jgi:aspartate/methionine/tyrosine aminotransferase